MLSIDPSSPFRGGALLGDRIRLTEHFLDPGVFIRSMATRGALGGLAEAALQTALLMDAAGKDDVFLETVGVGQAEVDVIDHADSVVLVLIPGSGDSIQALKAGVMEIPDIIVVNKSDHPLTDTMVREIRGVLSLAPQEGWRVPIVKTEAARGEGVEALAEKLAEHRAHVEAEGTLSERRRRNLMNEVLGIATVRLRRALEETLRDDPEVQALLGRGRRPPAGPGQRRERRARPRRGRSRRGRPSRRGLSRSSSSPLQRAGRALESRHAEGDPWFACAVALSRRCAPLPSPAGNGQLAAVADGTPRHAQPRRQRRCGRCRSPDAGQITELAFSPGRQPARVRQGGRSSRCSTSPRGGSLPLTAGASATPTRRGRPTALTIGFRRGGADLPRRGGTRRPRPSRPLSCPTRAPTDIAWAPDLQAFTRRRRGALVGRVSTCRRRSRASRRGRRTSTRSRSRRRRRSVDDRAGGGQVKPVLGGAGRPRRAGRRTRARWSTRRAREVRTRRRSPAGGAAAARAGRRARRRRVDWQPCVRERDRRAASRSRRRAAARLAATATTQADQPVDLPAPPCTDPAGRPLTLVVVKAPEHGTLAGLRYTPAPGFSGQDAVAYRVSNGVAESETRTA